MAQTEQSLEFYKIVGNRIRQAIAASGFANIDTFLLSCGVPKSTMSEILNGKNDVRLTTLAKIASGLEISLSELLEDSGIETWVRKEAIGLAGKKASKKPKKAAKKSKP